MGLLHIHEFICMMCWQMCPFPHTCPFGSVGGAGGEGGRKQVLGCPSGLGGWAAIRVTHAPTPFPPVFPFGFLSPCLAHSESHWFAPCHSLCLSCAVSDLPTPVPSVSSPILLSGSSCLSFHSVSPVPVPSGCPPIPCALSLPSGLSLLPRLSHSTFPPFVSSHLPPRPFLSLHLSYSLVFHSLTLPILCRCAVTHSASAQ